MFNLSVKTTMRRALPQYPATLNIVATAVFSVFLFANLSNAQTVSASHCGGHQPELNDSADVG